MDHVGHGTHHDSLIPEDAGHVVGRDAKGTWRRCRGLRLLQTKEDEGVAAVEGDLPAAFILVGDEGMRLPNQTHQLHSAR